MSSNGPAAGDLITMGLTLAGCLMAGFGLGWLVDVVVGSFPAIALVGLLLGIVAAGFSFYRQARRFM